jgi:hypothetical protein
MAFMQSQGTDKQRLPHRYRTWLLLTGLTTAQFHSVLTQISHQDRPARGRPWSLSLSVRILLVLIHLPTNLTTRALAALFATRQSTVDRVISHVIPMLANAFRPDGTGSGGPWVIDGTPIPVHDQSITAIRKNYRRSINTQVLINADTCAIVTVGGAWPGIRNDIVVAPPHRRRPDRRLPHRPRRRRIPWHRHHHRAPARTRRPDNP